MALSGFGQSPTNRGRANASHKAKPMVTIRPTNEYIPQKGGKIATLSLYLPFRAFFFFPETCLSD